MPTKKTTSKGPCSYPGCFREEWGLPHLDAKRRGYVWTYHTKYEVSDRSKTKIPSHVYVPPGWYVEGVTYDE